MHAETKDERIRLRVRESLIGRAEKWAERRGMSLSAYVRMALREKMDEDLLNDIRSKTDEIDGD